MALTVGLFVFDDMEMLDYAGPYQVFATASRLAETESGESAFSLVTIGLSDGPVRVRAGAHVVPDATIAAHPPLDCLIIPGGLAGVDALIEAGDAVTWLTTQAEEVPLVATVCTGAFLLAQTGLLAGLEATTHYEECDALRRRFPTITVVDNRRWVNSGRYVTSAGVSAGIDMALYLVERLTTRDLSVATARRLEL